MRWEYRFGTLNTNNKASERSLSGSSLLFYQDFSQLESIYTDYNRKIFQLILQPTVVFAILNTT